MHRRGHLLLTALLLVGGGCDRLLAFGARSVDDQRAAIDTTVKDGPAATGDQRGERSGAPEARAPSDARGPDLVPPDKSLKVDQPIVGPSIAWSTAIKSTDTIALRGIAAHVGSDTIAVAGSFTKSITFNTVTYVATGPVSDGLVATLGLGAPVAQRWLHHISGAGASAATDVVFSSGRILASGFVPSTGADALIYAAGPDRSGELTVSSSGAGGERATAIAVDPGSGDVLLAGSVQGQIAFGTSAMAPVSGSNFATELFLLRYKSDLKTVVWLKRWGAATGTSNATAEPRGITVESPGGAINVLGNYFGGLAGCPTAATKDLFRLRIDASGNDTCTAYSSPGNDEMKGAAGQGPRVCITGTLGGPLQLAQPLGGLGHSFVVCQDGTATWAVAPGAAGSTTVGWDLDLDSAGNLYVVGSYQAAIVTPPLAKPGGVADGFLISYDPGGKLRWASSYGGPGVDLLQAVAVVGPNDLVVAGQFTQSVTLGGGSYNCAPVCGVVMRLAP